MRRVLFAGLGVALVALVGYLLLLRNSSVAPRLVASEPVAVIGEGEDAVAVAADGTILSGWPPPKDDSLPQLPLEEAPPEGPRLEGTMLEQVRVLAATPDVLLPYVESSYFGESGVDVTLRTGIELRFGNSIGATRKWRAAAAVLASPDTNSLDYVDLHVPGHPATGGSGHTLPPLP